MATRNRPQRLESCPVLRFLIEPKCAFLADSIFRNIVELAGIALVAFHAPTVNGVHACPLIGALFHSAVERATIACLHWC